MGLFTIFSGIVFVLGQLNGVVGLTCYYYDSFNTNTFVRSCPGSYDSSDERYCCGSGISQYCCDGGSSTNYFNYGGVISGVVFALMVLGAIIFVVICLCVNAQKRSRGRVNHNPQGGMGAVMISQQQTHGMTQHPPPSGPIKPPPYSQAVNLQSQPQFGQPQPQFGQPQPQFGQPQSQFAQPQSQPQPFAMYPPVQQYPPPAADPAYPPIGAAP